MKIIELRHHMIDAGRIPSPDEDPVWRLSFTDKETGDTIWLAINQQVRDALIEKLTGGITLPKMVVPRGRNKH